MDPAQFFAASRLVIVAGKGGVGKTTVSAALARRSPPGPHLAHRRGRGQVRAGGDVRRAGLLLRRGHPPGRRPGHRARRGAGSHADPGRSPARVPGAVRHEPHLPTAGEQRCPGHGVHRGARHPRHPRPGQGQAARASGDRRPGGARCAGRRPRHLLPPVGRRPGRRRAARADQHPSAMCSNCWPTPSGARSSWSRCPRRRR
ncbi:hypothetical protein KSP35_17090 [Aquihabitans sp. G128]|nr:hypothetical protein KSP35_17090 [Aquihabitans sp. G128]